MNIFLTLFFGYLCVLLGLWLSKKSGQQVSLFLVAIALLIIGAALIQAFLSMVFFILGGILCLGAIALIAACAFIEPKEKSAKH